MTSEVSPFELVSKGLFRDASNYLDKQDNLPVRLQVLRAQLEVHVGTAATAQALAHRLLAQTLTNEEKSTCWHVVGRTSLTLGRVEDGLRAMTRALAAATATQDDAIESRLRADNAHALLQWVGVEAAALELPKLRQVAVRAGDAMGMIAVHSLVAEINARRGLVGAATSSIETARALLARFDNAWQRGRLAVIETGVAIIRSDYKTALECTAEALACAKRSGSREIQIPALGNLAFIKLAHGSFDEVRTTVRQLREEMRHGGASTAEISISDTEMLLALAEGKLNDAAAIESTISARLASAEGRGSYYEYWHWLTTAKWLYATADAVVGLTHSLETIPKLDRNGDRQLLALMRLQTAEGLGRLGRPYEASLQVVAAVETNPDGSLEFVAETYRVIGRLTAVEDKAAATTYFEQAKRILDGVGNLTARGEVERHAFEVLDVQTVDSRTSAAKEVCRLAALVESGSNGRLLAREAFSLVIDTASTEYVGVFEIDRKGKRHLIEEHGTCPTSAHHHDNLIQIPTGSFGDHSYELMMIPIATATARSTIIAIQRIVRDALMLVGSRQREREQGAISAIQTPERQLGLVCASERMVDLVKTIRRIAASPVNVLLTGETGVGKELFARALHQASPRSDRTFLPFNCATVPRDLFDSQLFGHKRGSFTGALNDSAGVIRAAAGGTLFLDEIGEMTLETQPKLLRFLESGEILPLGETKPQFVDVRIVAATNAKLDQHVADGRFREDLYYRLNVIRIEIPPLRERREEIPALVEHFLEKFGSELQKPMLRVADETLEYLVLYAWPGNVRQLANEIRRLVAMAEPGAVLMPAHLSEDIAASRRTISAETGPRKATEVVTRIDQSLAAAVEHIERAAIQRAIAVCEGRLDEAAKMLGLSRKGLYLKRQRLRLG
jgi:DNA-binding NtrC family response regulator